MKQPKNVIFWGAGATAALGIRTTKDQTKFIRRITGPRVKPPPLKERIAEALGQNGAGAWGSALFDLITILGDRDENYKSIDNIDDVERESMRQNWPGARDKELDSRILYLRLLYDWPALKSVVHICPGSSPDTFKLNDLFNLLDMHGPLGFGVRAPAPPEQGGEQFFDARRLIGATNALRMLLGASFYIDYQECICSKGDVLRQYLGFACSLGRRMQRQGIDIARQSPLDHPTFYQGDVDFVSLNYDPIALWVQFIANRELNKSASVPLIGSPAVPLHLFHDFGHLIPARRIGKGEADWPWYPMNEAVAQRLNEPTVSASRVRLTKFLFPHGCLCWRECPDCGKLSSYHGDQWKLMASGLFPPPPLQAFDKGVCPDWIIGEERTQREKGMIDARACLHCGTLTYAHHAQTVMQNSFKSPLPSFIEEIQRDLRAVAMQANHIIFMGYSLPPDDVTYRAFFSARCWRGKQENEPVRCTVVNLDNKHSDWYGPAELKNQSLLGGETVKAAGDIFGEDKVRFYGGGIPNVFLDGGMATDAALDRLLNWS